MKARLTGIGRTYLVLTGVLILMILVSGILVPGTLSGPHLLEIARQSVPLTITSIGQTFVILSGGIDLSVGQIITMTNILATDLMRGSSEGAIGIILGLLALGALIGLINGLVIANTNVPPLVMTFGMASMVKGGYLIYSGGAPKGSVAPVLRTIGAGRIGAVPISLILCIALIVIAVLIHKKTVWGRSVSYIGSNKTAALYSGIPVKSRIVLAYSISGLTATIAGLVLSGYIGIGNFDIGGDAYTLNSIGAVVIGGTTFAGQGGIGGAVLGSLMLTVLGSIMTSMGAGEPGKLIMRGLVIIAMVAIYSSGVRRRIGTVRPKLSKTAGMDNVAQR